MSNEAIGLEELFNYKTQLMKDVLSSEAIVKLLDDDCDPESLSDTKSLIYSQIFPFEFMPEPVEHGSTYICCEVDIREVKSKTFLVPAIYIWVFSHTSLLRLPDGAGVRTDKLTSELVKILNGNRFYGLGELNLYSVRRFSPVPNYQGRVIVFYTKDFNRISPTKMPVPANRRNGV